jgi:hypothetical protein
VISESKACFMFLCIIFPVGLNKMVYFHYTVHIAGESGLNGPSVSMDDPKLITKIRRKFLLSPSLHIEPYNLDSPLLYDTSMGQSEMILSILGDQVSQCQ